MLCKATPKARSGRTAALSLPELWAEYYKPKASKEEQMKVSINVKMYLATMCILFAGFTGCMGTLIRQGEWQSIFGFFSLIGMIFSLAVFYTVVKRFYGATS